MIWSSRFFLVFAFCLLPFTVQSETPSMCATYDGQHLEIPCVNAGEIYRTSFVQDSSGFVLSYAEKVDVSDISQCAAADIIQGGLSLPCVEVIGAPSEENLFWADFALLMGESIRLELLSAGLLDSSEEGECTDDLDRFSGTYSLDVYSQVLGIDGYAIEGENICGDGVDFFGDIPSTGSVNVVGDQVVLSADSYSVSATLQAPTEPKVPLVNGIFYEYQNVNASTAINSCGTESPYISGSATFPEDGGMTTLSVWVYLQESAISVVGEVFWIEDGSEILSPCHGVIVITGDQL